jgi:hypothetical protein
MKKMALRRGGSCEYTEVADGRQEVMLQVFSCTGNQQILTERKPVSYDIVHRTSELELRIGSYGLS